MNRYVTPVMFAFEKNWTAVHLYATFGSGGSVNLVTQNSLGVASINPNTPTFTANTTNSSSTVGTVSSFKGLFSGMSFGIAGGALQSGTTLGTISATTDSIVLSSQAILTGAQTLVASGGQYIIQFGLNNGNRFDSYFKLLSVQHSFDESTGSATGTATQSQLAPAAPAMLLIQNNTRVRTIPPTAATNSTDCSLTVQFGSGNGASFVAGTPAPGEAVRMTFIFGNSSAQ